MILEGRLGYIKVIETMYQIKSWMHGNRSDIGVFRKFDGAPAFVIGLNDKVEFFIGTKSAIDNAEKRAYSPEQIVSIYGQELSEKLYPVFRYMQDTASDFIRPNTMLQGDLLFTPSTKKVVDGCYQFRPNTITYRVAKDTYAGGRMEYSQVGVVFHTMYTDGNAYVRNFSRAFYNSEKIFNMSTQINPVCFGSNKASPSVTTIPITQISDNFFQLISDNFFSKILMKGINDYIKTVNRFGMKSYDHGFFRFLNSYFKDQMIITMKNYKTTETKQKYHQKFMEIILSFETMFSDWRNFLEMYFVVMNIKSQIIGLLEIYSTPNDFQCFYEKDGKLLKTKHEGYVVYNAEKQYLVKLVDRFDFSAQNFSRQTSSHGFNSK